MRDVSGTPLGSTVGYDIPIYAGGWQTTVDMVGARGVSGGDVWDVNFFDGTASGQQSMITTDLLPTDLILPNTGATISNSELGIGGMGGYAVRICPSNPDRVYLVLEGYVLRKDDWTGPARWIKTAGFPAQTALSNGGGYNTSDPRLWNYEMAVDPINADVVIVGYMKDGARYSLDAGATSSVVNNSASYQMVWTYQMRVIAKTSAQAAFQLVVNNPSGAGSVSVISNVITVTPPSGAGTPSQIAAQLNANGTFSASYVAQATLMGSNGTYNDIPAVTQNSNNTDWPILFAFDPSSATTGGKTQGVYMAVYGKGIYHSTTGVSGTFTLMSGSPVDPRGLYVDTSGRVWVLRDGYVGQNLYRYAGSTWDVVTIPSGSGNGIIAFCFDPTNNNRVFGMTTDSDLIISNNGGTSWLGPWSRNAAHRDFTAADSPWLGFAHGPQGLGGTGCIAYDTVNQRLYCSYGIGLAYAYPVPTTFSLPADKMHWFSYANAGRMIVSYKILSIPTKPYPLFMGGDRGVFQVTDFNRSPSSYGPGTTLMEGFDLDYAGNNYNFVACLVQYYQDSLGGSRHAYSLNAGAPNSWVYFPNQPYPTLGGGCMAVNTDQNMIYCPAYDGTPVWTKDRGATPWTPITFAGTGIPGSDKGFCKAGAFTPRKILTCDKTTGAFYIYCSNGDLGFANLGIWKNTNGGQGNWTRIYNSQLAYADDYFLAQFAAIPGVTRELLHTAGDIGGATNPAPSDFKHIIDNNNGTCTVTTIPGFQEVKCFGFGAKLDTADPYPTIYVCGWYNGGAGTVYTFGYWRIDHYKQVNQTITLHTARGKNHADAPRCINGDMNVYGRLYIGYTGSGYDRVDLEDKRNLVLS